MIGRKEGPTKTDMQELQQWVGRGYICGNRVPSNLFYVQRKCFCGDYIESQYDNHLGGKKRKDERGGRLVTKNVCAICYTFYNVMSRCWREKFINCMNRLFQ